MQEKDLGIGNLGFQVVRVLDDGNGDILEKFEQEVEEFLSNPTILQVVDINYQQSMVSSQLSGVKIQWIAFITVRYDKQMHERIIAEQEGQQTLNIEQ